MANFTKKAIKYDLAEEMFSDYLVEAECTEECINGVRAAIMKFAPEFKEIIETTAGSTITTHCGPNTLGILFVRKK